MSTNFRRKMKYKNILTKKFLIQEYIKNRKSVHEIAEQINFYDSIIYIYLIRYNISRRTQSEAMKGKYIRKRSWKYIDNRTNKQHYCIESNCNNKISYSNWLNGNRKCQSCASKRKRLNISKKFLIKEYINNKKSSNKIAKEINCGVILLGIILKNTI